MGSIGFQDSVGEASAEAREQFRADGEPVEVTIYFRNLLSRELFVVEMEMAASDFSDGQFYERILSIWGRLVNYRNMQFDRCVAKRDASIVLGLYAGLQRFVESQMNFADQDDGFDPETM